VKCTLSIGMGSGGGGRSVCAVCVVCGRLCGRGVCGEGVNVRESARWVGISVRREKRGMSKTLDTGKARRKEGNN